MSIASDGPLTWREKKELPGSSWRFHRGVAETQLELKQKQK